MFCKRLATAIFVDWNIQKIQIASAQLFKFTINVSFWSNFEPVEISRGPRTIRDEYDVNTPQPSTTLDCLHGGDMKFFSSRI